MAGTRLRTAGIVGAIAVIVTGVSLWMAFRSPAHAVDNKVAQVGAVTITMDDVTRCIPEELFGLARHEAQATRLNRLVTTADQRQRLLEHGAQADDASFEPAFHEFITNPTSGCACHTYKNFDDYLRQTYQTIDDVRADFWNKRALALYCEQAWEQKYPGAAGKQAVIATEGPEIRQQFRWCWSLWLQSDESAANAGQADDIWFKVADMAYQRLSHGEEWKTVVEGLVPDSESKASMLSPRVMPVEECRLAGLTMAQMADACANIVQKPCYVDGRWLVSRWVHLPDDEVITYSRSRFLKKIETDFLDEVYQHPRVQYFGEGITLTSGTTGN